MGLNLWSGDGASLDMRTDRYRNHRKCVDAGIAGEKGKKAGIRRRLAGKAFEWIGHKTWESDGEGGECLGEGKTRFLFESTGERWGVEDVVNCTERALSCSVAQKSRW